MWVWLSLYGFWCVVIVVFCRECPQMWKITFNCLFELLGDQHVLVMVSFVEGIGAVFNGKGLNTFCGDYSPSFWAMGSGYCNILLPYSHYDLCHICLWSVYVTWNKLPNLKKLIFSGRELLIHWRQAFIYCCRLHQVWRNSWKTTPYMGKGKLTEHAQNLMRCEKV